MFKTQPSPSIWCRRRDLSGKAESQFLPGWYSHGAPHPFPPVLCPKDDICCCSWRLPNKESVWSSCTCLNSPSHLPVILGSKLVPLACQLGSWLMDSLSFSSSTQPYRVSGSVRVWGDLSPFWSLLIGFLLSVVSLTVSWLSFFQLPLLSCC